MDFIVNLKKDVCEARDVILIIFIGKLFYLRVSKFALHFTYSVKTLVQKLQNVSSVWP